MLTLTLDTNCFKPDKNLQELMEMYHEEKINLQISDRTWPEIIRTHPSKLKLIAEQLSSVVTLKEDDVDQEEFQRIGNEAIKILRGELTDLPYLKRVVSSPEEWMKYGEKNKNDNADVDIFTLHVISNADIFVTRDKKAFINNGRKEKFENTFKTKVRFLDDNFIIELKATLRT